MFVKRLKVKNFKSFEKLDIELKNFNVIIGANASGKSNFLEILKFLKDVAERGLGNAISMQGGQKYFQNLKIGNTNNFAIEITFEYDFMFGADNLNYAVQLKEIIHSFEVKFVKDNSFNLIKDKLILKCDFVDVDKKTKEITKVGVIQSGEFIIKREKNKPKLTKTNVPDSFNDDMIIPPMFENQKIPADILLTAVPLLLFPFDRRFKDISIFNFEPQKSKKATPVSGNVELDDDGNNLAIVLKNLNLKKSNNERFNKLMKDVLGFYEDVDVDEFTDNSYLLKVKENYFKNEFFPSTLISDGTINIIALIIALYFNDRELMIFEEPERNIHPHLISKVVSMMKEVSKEKQILITSHNPIIIKNVDIENIFCISRDQDGFSRITKPIDNEEVITFMKNEIGLDELLIDNLL